MLLAGCAAPLPLSAVRTGFAPAVERVVPSTVGVYAVPGTGLPQDEDAVDELAGSSTDDASKVPRVGAGFAVDAEGTLATAAHLLEGCESIVVRLADGRVQRAHKLAVDDGNDIALLRIAPGLVRPPAFGRSTALRAGDWVLAIGEPLGLGRAVTLGIVGSTDRHFAEDEEATFVQSDVAINPGNSGGPLVDRSGAVVGMNVRIVVAERGSSGITLSLPIELVLQAAAEMRSGRPSQRPRLEAEYTDIPPLYAAAHGHGDSLGALVRSVTRGGTADRLGLLPGDMVLSFNGQAVRSAAEFARRLLAWRQAEGTRVTVARGGQRQALIYKISVNND